MFPLPRSSPFWSVRSFCNCSIKLGNCLCKICDLLGELCNAGLKLINLCMQCFHCLGLLLSRLFIGGQLRVAPALVLSFLVSFLHELDDEILDHLFHLLEWIFS